MTDPGIAGTVRRYVARAQFRRWLGIYFAAAAGWFFLGVLVGVALAGYVSLADLAERAGEDGALVPGTITVTTIAVNNLVALGVDALGLVTVGLASVVMLVLNGVVAGLVVALGAGETSLALMLVLIVPHGVIELPAFWLVAGVSFRIYHRMARYVVGRDDEFLGRQEVFEVAVLFAVAAAMIVVAAIVEVHVTLRIAEVLTGERIEL